MSGLLRTAAIVAAVAAGPVSAADSFFRQGGWPVPEVAIATSATRPLSHSSMTLDGQVVSVDTYRPTGRVFEVPPSAIDLDADAWRDQQASVVATGSMKVYSVRSRAFRIVLHVELPPPPADCVDCPICACLWRLMLVDDDGDGVFETLAVPNPDNSDKDGRPLALPGWAKEHEQQCEAK
jgi:hypothetical protein